MENIEKTPSTLLHIQFKQYPQQVIVCNEIYYKEVWELIKKTFSDTHAYYIDNLSKMLSDNIKYANNYEEQEACQYIADVIVEDTIIDIKAYMRECYDQKITCYTDRYITKISNEGNCIDDFIQRGVESRLSIINDLVDSIKSRVNERQMAIEYHNTWCYEKDYTQISLLKKQAEKIVENCATQLERISEKYTKL